jgi:N-acetylglutamate synthase-like GNAT family acetyltransferase
MEEQMAAHERLFRAREYFLDVRNIHLTLATNGDEIIGSAGWCTHDSSAARVRKVFVKPSHAKLGLGRSLLCYVEGQIRKAGLSEVFLRASLNAVPFYERVGYRQLRQERVPLEGGILAKRVIMGKTLE